MAVQVSPIESLMMTLVNASAAKFNKARILKPLKMNSKIYFKYLILHSHLDVQFLAASKRSSLFVVMFDEETMSPGGLGTTCRKTSGDCMFLFPVRATGQFMSQAAFKRDDFWFIWEYPQLPCCPVAGQGHCFFKRRGFSLYVACWGLLITLMEGKW